MYDISRGPYIARLFTTIVIVKRQFCKFNFIVAYRWHYRILKTFLNNNLIGHWSHVSIMLNLFSAMFMSRWRFRYLRAVLIIDTSRLVTRLCLRMRPSQLSSIFPVATVRTIAYTSAWDLANSCLSVCIRLRCRIIIQADAPSFVDCLADYKNLHAK